MAVSHGWKGMDVSCSWSHIALPEEWSHWTWRFLLFRYTTLPSRCKRLSNWFIEIRKLPKSQCIFQWITIENVLIQTYQMNGIDQLTRTKFKWKLANENWHFHSFEPIPFWNRHEKKKLCLHFCFDILSKDVSQNAAYYSIYRINVYLYFFTFVSFFANLFMFNLNLAFWIFEHLKMKTLFQWYFWDAWNHHFPKSNSFKFKLKFK